MTRTIYRSPGFVLGFMGVDLTVSSLLPRALQMSASGRSFGIVACCWQCNVSIKKKGLNKAVWKVKLLRSFRFPHEPPGGGRGAPVAGSVTVANRGKLFSKLPPKEAK